MANFEGLPIITGQKGRIVKGWAHFRCVFRVEMRHAEESGSGARSLRWAC